MVLASFAQNRGQHADQQVGHGIQCPGRPWRIRCPDDQRAGQPGQDAQSRPHREHLGLIHIADAAECPHGVDNGFILQTTYAIGPESLNTRHILHNAADILRTNIILFFTILPNHTEGKPQSRDQKQVGNQQDNSGRHIMVITKIISMSESAKLFARSPILWVRIFS